MLVVNYLEAISRKQFVATTIHLTVIDKAIAFWIESWAEEK
ncbi:MAG: hypothetical protein WBM86_09530 [Waterburya sp.]